MIWRWTFEQPAQSCDPRKDNVLLMKAFATILIFFFESFSTYLKLPTMGTCLQVEGVMYSSNTNYSFLHVEWKGHVWMRLSKSTSATDVGIDASVEIVVYSKLEHHNPRCRFLLADSTYGLLAESENALPRSLSDIWMLADRIFARLRSCCF